MFAKNKTNNMYKAKYVMSIHGISTTGEWQETLRSVLEEMGLESLEYKYSKFVNPWAIDDLVDKFRDWYFLQVRTTGGARNIDKPYHRP